MSNYRQTKNYENLERRIFEGVGMYGIPQLEAEKEFDNCEWISFNYAKSSSDRKNKLESRRVKSREPSARAIEQGKAREASARATSTNYEQARANRLRQVGKLMGHSDIAESQLAHEKRRKKK